MQIALNSVPSAKPVEPMTPTVDKLGKVGKEKLRKTSRAVSEQRKAEQFLKEMETCRKKLVLGMLETDGNSRDDLIFCNLCGVLRGLSPAVLPSFSMFGSVCGTMCFFKDL